MMREDGAQKMLNEYCAVLNLACVAGARKGKGNRNRKRAREAMRGWGDGGDGSACS